MALKINIRNESVWITERQGKMDYSLAAPKVMCGQLRKAKETTSQNAFTLGGVLFQRAWLQGVLVSVSDDAQGRFVLDDGTGVIHLSLSGDFLHRNWKIGALFATPSSLL